MSLIVELKKISKYILDVSSEFFLSDHSDRIVFKFENLQDVIHVWGSMQPTAESKLKSKPTHYVVSQSD